ncbi:hypothetical protein DVR12_16485 [Chitinophaga silvatica]|uniref:Uncharacterized protein n=1 Tax=Chitinophaga silvatica TaxID=2282649 RepID=A0A3E1Y793_9BACT|nr:hypothetical protein [Chitinophaga silvatica]RFS20949.1 hypothetical protein DVR12_16485 [Chitinophaga silvatica]
MLHFIAKKSTSLLDSKTIGEFIDNLDHKLSSSTLDKLVSMLNKYYYKIKCSEHPDSDVTIEMEYLGLGNKKMAFYLSPCCCTEFENQIKEKLQDVIDRNIGDVE